MEQVLVAGATGTTGNIIINILKQSEHFTPVAMVRKEEQVKDFKEKGIEAILGDLSGKVDHVTKNIDKVIFAAGSKGKDVKGIDKEGAIKLIDASISEGVKKFVMLSSMGTQDPQSVPELEDYLKAKKAADHYLMKSNISYTIVRPGSLTNKKGQGKIDLEKYLDRKGEISREDVAQTLVKALDTETANNLAFEILEGHTPVEQALKQAHEVVA
ncbi:SDR family oxidoreductase [Robertkochia marina]|uniref:SDR family oxidoreductase n=1 Tax=Robertkochia marina TaxID=1227945 RepID=A0A4V3UYC8_9FLAO|nr:SDR family oxidoreductase [Robertkochia marina]THD69148.1 SDR family oxidoreductase [Robertkochia marina]TRZ47593.1 SDR family oxidoreductase [Robertkochia marina]